MDERDWDYSPVEWAEAHSNTTDVSRLKQLATHHSRFVRAPAAGNANCPKELRQILSKDSSSGVRYWVACNPSLTKNEFDIMYRECNKSSGDHLTIAIVSSPHADMAQLTEIKHSLSGDWGIKIAILNNYRNRGDDYRELIASYLPPAPTEKPVQDWSEVEKLAYLRTFSRRRPL